MAKYQALAVVTSYWKPNENYLNCIEVALKDRIRSGDFVVISEKALSVAIGNIVEERKVVASRNAKFIADFWMRIIWGYNLGFLCGFGQRLLKRLRSYPLESGSRHKQLVLERSGLLQALMFGSEGGIDGSNLAYTYVSLPLQDACEFAKKIQTHIQTRLDRNINVIVADTDKTYRFYNFYFTPRPNSLKGIHCFGGVVTYVLGRILGLKRSSTPLAVAGCDLSATHALTLTNIADRARGVGSGATVWDMAARFNVDLDMVTWEMLSGVTHKPLVLVRKTG